MAAQYGSFTFAMSGTAITKDIYCDDTAGNAVNWDGGAGSGANSPEFWTAPASGKIVDFTLAAATGQTKTQVIINDTPQGTMFRNALHLVSAAKRPLVGINVPGGAKITLIQLA